MATTLEVVEAYSAAWNEPDGAKRQELLEKCWAPGGTYTDPTAHVEGTEALAMHITKLREQMSYELEMSGAPDEHHGRVRFAWVMRTADGNTLAQGVDFGILAPDGRIQSITGFFDPRS
jgi:hypothetical protein